VWRFRAREEWNEWRGAGGAMAGGADDAAMDARGERLQGMRGLGGIVEVSGVLLCSLLAAEEGKGCGGGGCRVGLGAGASGWCAGFWIWRGGCWAAGGEG
jgi:hypothetical protein